MVTIEAEDGNIFEAEAIANPPAAPEAFTAASEAEDSENEEVQTSIFDAVVTNQPGRVALTPDDLVDLWAHRFKIDENNQLVLENAEPPDELEVVGKCVLLQTCHQKMNGHFNNKGK